MDYQHLSTLLWREQELLDLLLFKAEEKQYL
ncbi:MAG: flgN, partial [Blastococcus sp.]|nr:flgN [Blastococcus sp.]